MYAHMQGRPTYFIAYDSMTADSGSHGPTDTPLPAQPTTTHRRISPEPAVETQPDVGAQPSQLRG
jgi:dolichol-phosphate mannosyltransferase